MFATIVAVLGLLVLAACRADIGLSDSVGQAVRLWDFFPDWFSHGAEIRSAQGYALRNA